MVQRYAAWRSIYIQILYKKLEAHTENEKQPDLETVKKSFLINNTALFG
jgi:hypothetical protein